MQSKYKKYSGHFNHPHYFIVLLYFERLYYNERRKKSLVLTNALKKIVMIFLKEVVIWIFGKIYFFKVVSFNFECQIFIILSTCPKNVQTYFGNVKQLRKQGSINFGAFLMLAFCRSFQFLPISTWQIF